MGALENDLDYGLKVYRENLIKYYNNNNGDIIKVKILMKNLFINTNDKQIEQELEFLGNLGFLKQF